MKIQIIKCDVCGREQDTSHDIYWASRVAHCTWKVPPDGINGGRFEGDLCQDCRSIIQDSISKAVKALKDETAAKALRYHDHKNA